MDNNIHVVAVSSCFDNARELLARVKKELALFKGKRVLLLFPEGVIAHTNPNGAIITYTIERTEGRALARSLHELAAAHGSAYMAYSVLEGFPEPASANNKRAAKLPLESRDYGGAVNAGYLITPNKEHKLGYKVYPKLTTYRQGTILTQFDGRQLAWHYQRYEDMAAAVKRRARLTKQFPEVVIDGKRVQVRVCSDVLPQKQHAHDPDVGHYLIQDPHPARNTRAAHLILSPSQNAYLDAHIEHIASQLAPKGIFVSSDAQTNRGTVRVISRGKAGHTHKFVEKTKSVRHKGFTIHHKP